MIRYVTSFRKHVRLLGPLKGSLAFAARTAFKIVPSSRHKLRQLDLTDLPHPIFLRPGTSDWDVLSQVFVSQEYKCPSALHYQALCQFYTDLVSESAIPLIIDCGANIGLAAIWYAQRFPKAKIIAVEPEPDNFSILARNVAYYPNISAVQAGISDHETRVSLSNTGDSPWAWETTESDLGTIRTCTIPGLLASVPNGRLMVVKIDIEGSEVALFRSNLDWVAKTALVAFESHDWLFAWRGTFHAVLSALTKAPRDYLQNGEITFSFSHSMLRSQSNNGDTALAPAI